MHSQNNLCTFGWPSAAPSRQALRPRPPPAQPRRRTSACPHPRSMPGRSAPPRAPPGSTHARRRAAGPQTGPGVCHVRLPGPSEAVPTGDMQAPSTSAFCGSGLLLPMSLQGSAPKCHPTQHIQPGSGKQLASIFSCSGETASRRPVCEADSLLQQEARCIQFIM